MTETERDGIQAALIERCNALEAEVERMRGVIVRWLDEANGDGDAGDIICRGERWVHEALAAHPEPIADEEGQRWRNESDSSC